MTMMIMTVRGKKGAYLTMMTKATKKEEGRDETGDTLYFSTPSGHERAEAERVAANTSDKQGIYVHASLTCTQTPKCR